MSSNFTIAKLAHIFGESAEKANGTWSGLIDIVLLLYSCYYWFLVPGSWLLVQHSEPLPVPAFRFLDRNRKGGTSNQVDAIYLLLPVPGY